MRNFYLIFFGALLFIACNKDLSLHDQNTDPVQARSNSNLSVVTYNSEQIPYFPDFDSFVQKAEELDSLVVEWEDEFYSTYSNQQNEPINWDSIATATGYKEQQPLIDFENSINFNNSLRKDFNIQEELWMQDTTELHPFDKYHFFGSELSLVNSKQRFMVGDTIYQINGEEIYKIYGDYSETLASIDNNNVGVGPELKFISLCIPVGNDVCTPWKSSTTGYEYQFWNFTIIEAVFMKCKVSFRSWCGIPNAAAATVKLYSMNDNKTNWDPYKTELIANVQSVMYKGRKCGTFYTSQGNVNHKKYSHSLTVTRRYYTAFTQLRTKNANIYGASHGTIGIFDFPKIGLYKELPLGW